MFLNTELTEKTKIFVLFEFFVFNINLCVSAALRSKNKIFYSLSQFS